MAGCGGGSSGGPTTTPGTGTIRVELVDALDPSVTAVNITINRVEAHINNEWRVVTTTPRTFDLLDLVRNEMLLASSSLPVGRYNQVRFFPTAATVTDNTGTHPVTTPARAGPLITT